MRFFIVALLYATAFTPLIELRNAELGATAGKIIVFRMLVEGALIVWALRVYFAKQGYGLCEAKKLLRNPVIIAFCLFLLSMTISAIGAVNPARAFWGTLERGEGVFGVLHYLALLLFIGWFLKEKERLALLKAFLISGYALMAYGLQEAFQGLSRITSYIGNAAFFGEHLLFLIASAFIVMKESKTKGIWWFLAAGLIPLGILGIALTKTRGAILGLGVGGLIFCFGWAVQKFGKKILWGAAAVCVAGSIALWASNGVQAPSMERSGSIQTRLSMWRAGWDAFRERPVFGWGGEHFILASSVHYNPKAARAGETWFDRAHNQIVDILVAQGAVGGVILLGFFLGAFFTVWRDMTYKKSLAFAFGGAYLTQGMFAPDQIVSWLGLMVFFGWLLGSKRREDEKKREEEMNSKIGKRIGAIGSGALALAALYYGNIMPYIQLKTLFQAKGAEEPSSLLRRAFAKHTFARAEAEAKLFDFYMENRPNLIIEKDVGGLIRDEALSLLEDEPQDIRHGIQYARILLEQAQRHLSEKSGAGQGKNNNALYNEAEKELNNLLRVAPKRQELFYLLASVKGLQGKVEEAIEVAERAVEIAPDVARAHYILGVALLSSEKPELQEQAEKELIVAEKLNPSLDALQNSDVDILISIYKSRKRWDRVADIALRNATGVISWTSFDEPVFIKGLLYFAKEKKKNEFIKIARYVEERFPEEKEAAIQAIEFAEQEKWEIIQSMFEVE